LQLDLFVPRDYVYEYTVIVTNRSEEAADVIAFHHGRGSQEKIFGEAKQSAALGVVATHRSVGNPMFTLMLHSACAPSVTQVRELQGDEPPVRRRCRASSSTPAVKSSAAPPRWCSTKKIACLRGATARRNATSGFTQVGPPRGSGAAP